MSKFTDTQLNALVPTPKKLQVEDGDLILAPYISTDYEPFAAFANTFCESIEKIFSKKNIASVKEGGIVLSYNAVLPENAYTFDTLGETAILSASSCEGIAYAVSTLTNLVSFEGGELRIRRVHIEDAPDKDYRTLMVDLGREWHPAHLIYRYIDVCFMFKIKYLHLHFMDDPIYTLPSRVLPDVTKNSPHYTFEDIEGFRAYANARGVSIIPEIEVPGHAIALIKAYPELFGLRIEGDASAAEIITEQGDRVSTDGILCAGNKESLDAVLALINEVCDLFPESKYINVGCDEANINAWNYCTECKKYMKEHNQKNVEEMYCEFVGKITSATIARGKTPIVWEGFPKEYSYLVPKETVVLSWENHYNFTEDLLADGFRIINASWQPLYIIPAYDRGWACEDIYAWNVYNWQHWWVNSRATINPVNVAPTDQVIGAQICSWESTYDQEINKIFDSLSTMSERTWNVRRVCSHEAFAARLRPFVMRTARLIQDR